MMSNRNPENKGFKNAMTQVFVTAAVFYVALVGLMYVLQRNFLYFPTTYLPTPAQSMVGDMEEVRFTTEDGLELLAWAKGPAREGKAWVVLFHGNAGTIAGRGPKARLLLDAGYGVLLVEYRGYGGNPGAPSEDGLFADARAALGYLAERGVRGKNLVLFGESLGTGVAVAMAAQAAQAGHPVAAVLLEAPYTSIADVAAGHYPFLPVRLLLKDRFDSLGRIGGIGAPLFIVHGAQDLTVPQTLGRKLFAAAKAPKDAAWLEEAGHNDVMDFGAMQAMLAYLRGHNI